MTMLNRQPVHTDQAPAAVGPYSQAIISNGFVFVSGQTPIDPSTGKLIDGDIAAQTEQVFKNLTAILEAAGTSLANVVKATVFLHEMRNFSAMNAVYTKFFPGAPPARSTIGNLDLPLGAQVEIEVIALLPPIVPKQLEQFA